MKTFSITFLLALCFVTSLVAQTTIILPEPQKKGGMPLMEALSKRATARAFDTTSLTSQQISNLLWAAFGINRSDGKRTAPSARNFQETDIYVLTKTGVYIYDAPNHQLNLVINEDIRILAGIQPFVKDAPITLLLIADLGKMGDGKPEDKLNTAHIDAGYISQNVYLYCVSDGLVTGARGMVNRENLTTNLKLNENHVIILAQSVGFPKK